MEPSESAWRLEIRRSFSEIPAAGWDALAGSENPFVSHAFLSSLEDSGCIGPGTGWLPFPALLYQGEALRGAAPSFVKLDSKGEYVFDYSWADAYDQLYGPARSYYPKLQVAVPFSPVPGPRLLVGNEPGPEPRRALLAGLLEFARGQDLSGVHLTFAQQEEVALACRDGSYLHRMGEQYHWHNDGYSSFDDFLASLASRKRKALKRERRLAHEHPVSFHTVHGDQATEEQWDALYRMYIQTSRRKWGDPYLNRDFFRRLAQRMGNKVVLFLVRREPEERWIAGAWNLRGNDALFGRNWGCLEHFDMLHFEVCYYQAIDYAIAHGLSRVEAGAQGFHKIQRGYRPVAVHSAHHLADPAFARLVADYLQVERREERQRLAALEELTPFSKAAG